MPLSNEKKIEIIEENYQTALAIFQKEQMHKAELLANHVIEEMQVLLADEEIALEAYHYMEVTIVRYLNFLGTQAS